MQRVWIESFAQGKEEPDNGATDQLDLSTGQLAYISTYTTQARPQTTLLLKKGFSR